MLLCSGPENGRFWQKRAANRRLLTRFYVGNTGRQGFELAKEQLAACPLRLEMRLM